MPLLEIRALCKNFGGLTAVKNLTFEVNRNEILGFIGPNGSGKTTTFNLITGFYSPESGSIKFKGEEIAGLEPHAVAKRGIGRTFQLSKPLSKLTVLENVMTGGFLKDKNVKRVKKRAKEILEFTGLLEKEDILAGGLTLEDRRLLEVGRALAIGPELILIDEIVAGLNPTETVEIMVMLKKIRDQGVTIVMVEHVMQAVMGISDRVVVIDHGEKVAEGSPQGVSKNERVIEAYLGKEYIT